MKKIFTFIIFILFISVFAIKVTASTNSYSINFQDKFTVTASIMKIIDTGVYNINDLPIFYSILNDLESDDNTMTFSADLNQLLISKGLNFTSSSSYTTEQWKSDSYYIYEKNAEDSYVDTFNPINGVITEHKRLEISGTKVNFSYIPNGTIKIFVGSCPAGWVNNDNGGGIEIISLLIPNIVHTTCRKVGSSYTYNETSTTKTSISDYFTSTTSSYISFNYGQYLMYTDLLTKTVFEAAGILGYSINPDVTITLINDDVLIIDRHGSPHGTPFIFTKFDHYHHRFAFNQKFNANNSFPYYQDDFTNQFIDSLSNYDCSLLPNYARYFHRLAPRNGDTFYQTVNKYTCTINNSEYSYEVVYDQNKHIVDEPLVLGTYNYYDPVKGQDDLHWLYDVYPYLFWGNTKTDDSNIHERFIWNYDSAYIYAIVEASFPNSILGYEPLYQYRGDELYQAFYDDYYPSCMYDLMYFSLLDDQLTVTEEQMML